MGRALFRHIDIDRDLLRLRRRPIALRRTLRFEPLEERRLLAAFTVSNLDDLPVAMSGDAPGTLRQAIFDANNVPGPDTIEFDAGLTSDAAATILLSQGELEISESLTMLGPGAGLLTIDAAQQSRTFNITATTGDFTLSGLALTGGRTTGMSPLPKVTTFNGGEIRSLSTGNLSLSASSVNGNLTTGDQANGGGIFCVGSVTLTNCTVSGNRTMGEPARGGGIWAGGNVTLIESVVSGNHTAGSRGGGIYSLSGNVSLTQSTVSGNSSIGSRYSFSGGGGAGIFALNGNVSLSYSTVSDNSTELDRGGGAGIVAWSYGTSVTLTNSTVSGNSTAGAKAYGRGCRAAAPLRSPTARSAAIARQETTPMEPGFSVTGQSRSLIAPSPITRHQAVVPAVLEFGDTAELHSVRALSVGTLPRGLIPTGPGFTRRSGHTV